MATAVECNSYCQLCLCVACDGRACISSETRSDQVLNCHLQLVSQAEFILLVSATTAGAARTSGTRSKAVGPAAVLGHSFGGLRISGSLVRLPSHLVVFGSLSAPLGEVIAGQLWP